MIPGHERSFVHENEQENAGVGFVIGRCFRANTS